MKKGKFIVLEGIDGSGKSTQAALLKKRLSENNIPCYATREPTDSAVGRLIRSILKGETIIDGKAMGYLFAADRIDHLTNKANGLCSIIQSGKSVICDRYYFSSYAYHSTEIDMDFIINQNKPCAELLNPDCTLFIDISPRTAMDRIAAGRTETELYENLERLTLVRKKYLEAFSLLSGSERVEIINGEQSPEKVAEDIWKILAALKGDA